MLNSLLPPNASPLERALEAAMARLSDVPAPLAPLWDPAICPPDLLPWLAWGLSVDDWNPDWPIAMKRELVSRSIALHRIKGTRASVEVVLARYDALARVLEWWEARDPGDPAQPPAHTFEVILPVAGPGVPAGGARATAAFAEAIARDVARAKPLREHFRIVQRIGGGVRVGLAAFARLLLATRSDYAFTDDRSQPWELFLQTEDGEPLQGGTGEYLEHAA